MGKKAGGIILLIFLGCLSSWFLYVNVMGNPNSFPAVKEEDSREEEEKRTITLTATGDCLMHNTQIISGKEADGSYNFASFFVEVEDLIKEGDYASVCFEAPMAGKEAEYTGYPLFNSPDEIASTFKEAGFDLVVTAHNHIMDRGYKGALRTMKVLEEAGLDYVGTYKTREDSEKFLIRDIKGIKVGYIAYTYSTNGIPVPPEHAYFLNYLDEEKILRDIEKLRPEVDVLILVLHWGVEYSPLPTQEQRIMAHKFLEKGADVILGSHPHVIQPMEVVNIGGKDKVIFYSMGNFISHQRGIERNSGIVVKLRFTKDMRKDITVLEEASYTPTFSHSYYDNGRLRFRVVPVRKTIEKIVNGEEPYLDKSYIPVLEGVLNATTSTLGPPFYRGQD
ncbi:poly-gamma-glutamate synthesis protein (capsule biosynthesis protein) [Thermosyntropha lipolytica DSM 11003]|uniref:Poly-gamma-glutamate synthesis protein (Capsule biosynthesis protein) n=1 Tax=Thermosyntropha lipolytica DSM 11003 TaxID=1123382 RepID=A0A1M5QN72_9FIRM|nr:CapA family protein [Thermosyntropha lipolytica]SHH15378.1 poly-gamma-glutamate synthesis protein (capsule biosynthesis protein) [Thermosyntropha lipolytica DSM 11003]